MSDASATALPAGNDPRIAELLTYWLGAAEPTDADALTRQSLWFIKSADTDAQIGARFGPLVEEALSGSLDGWAESARGRLALILLLDQFPRNLFRGTPKSFAGDTQGIGRPTPEGAHRDGVDLVAVFLVGREHVKGGETRVFEATGPQGQRFTLTEPWSLMLLDDARMIHETTPIQPVAEGGYRDTLVVTCRRDGFQGAEFDN